MRWFRQIARIGTPTGLYPTVSSAIRQQREVIKRWTGSVTFTVSGDKPIDRQSDELFSEGSHQKTSKVHVR